MRAVLLAGLATLAVASPAGAGIPGDTIEEPLPVPTIPFVASGSTCSYNPVYDEFCPIDGGLSPDVVYAYVAAADVVVNVSLCESRYDTKILVYENDAGHLYACNDDWCDGPYYDYPYLAYLRELPLSAGNTYYFVVDGYFNSCGLYVLRITESLSCEFVCPEGAEPEPEVPCVSGSADTVNAGCGSDPPVFLTLPPSPEPIAICGITNAAFGSDGRDEDWYEIVPVHPDTITVQCKGDFGAYLTVFDGASGCEEPPVLGYRMTEPCEKAGLPVIVPAGPLWIRVRPVLGWSVDCPANYVLTIRGYDGDVTAIPPPGDVSRPGDNVRLTIAPNPFADAVSIRGTIPADGGPAALRIYDAAGRLVRTLHDGPALSPFRELTWEGRDDSGVRVAGGTYFVRLSTPAGARTRKVVFLGGKH